MPWADFVRRLKDQYCPREEIKRLEQEYGNLKMVGSEVEAYTVRHNELAIMCPGLSVPEYRRIEQYIAGLVPEIAGLVSARDPATMSEAVRSATKMTNLKISEGVLAPRGSAAKAPADNKRKWENVEKGSTGQRQSTAKKDEASGSTSEQKQGGYAGKSPKCDKCGFHHYGACDKIRCERCKRIGHLAKDCRVNLSAQPTTTTTPPTPQGTQGCFNCGEMGHIKRNCPKLNKVDAGTSVKGEKDKDDGRPTRAYAYVIGSRENREDPDTVTRTYSLYLSLHIGFILSTWLCVSYSFEHFNVDFGHHFLFVESLGVLWGCYSDGTGELFIPIIVVSIRLSTGKGLLTYIHLGEMVSRLLLSLFIHNSHLVAFGKHCLNTHIGRHLSLLKLVNLGDKISSNRGIM